MEYAYSTFPSESSGRETDVKGLTDALGAAGYSADRGRIVGLLAALEDGALDDADSKATALESILINGTVVTEGVTTGGQDERWNRSGTVNDDDGGTDELTRGANESHRTVTGVGR